MGKMVVNRSCDSQISLIEFEDRLGLGVGVGLAQLAAPENVIGDKKAAALQARQR